MILAKRKETAVVPRRASFFLKHECTAFFLRWLAAPLRMGAVLPSSKYLARAIADGIERESDLPIVELGGGTGSVTRALLETGINPRRLIVVERDAHLCALLRRRFSHVRIVHGDACELTELTRALNIGTVSSMVSCLPLLSLPKQTRDSIVFQCLRLLGDKGRFIQFTYGLRSPLAGYDLAGTVAARIWRNLPPASVWHFEGAR